MKPLIRTGDTTSGRFVSGTPDPVDENDVLLLRRLKKVGVGLRVGELCNTPDHQLAPLEVEERMTQLVELGLVRFDPCRGYYRATLEGCTAVLALT